MNVTKQMILVMAVIGVLSSLLLAASNQLTKPLIEKNKLENLRNAIFQVLPDAKNYEEMSTETLKIYKGLDANQKVVGYAFVADGPGFQGNIRMMVGITPDLTALFGMSVLEQAETPGLGANIATESFQKQFANLKLAIDSATASALRMPATQGAPAAQVIPSLISYVKNVAPQKPGEIQAITGATISSKAVVNTLNQKLVSLYQVVQE